MTERNLDGTGASISAGTPFTGHADVPERLTLAIDEIDVDHNVHPRAEISSLDVRRFRRVLSRGQSLDPPTVFFDGSEHILSDGFGRLEAYRAEGRLKLEVERLLGSRQDAVIYAIKANAKHGRKLTNAEKRSAVGTMLANKDWVSRSAREIAEMCGCTHPTVSRIRKRMIVSGKISSDITRTIRTKHGKRVATKRANRSPKKRGSTSTGSGIDEDGIDVPRAARSDTKGRGDGQSPYDSAESAIERLEAARDAIGDPVDLVRTLISSDSYKLFKRFESLRDWVEQLAEGYQVASSHFKRRDRDTRDI